MENLTTLADLDAAIAEVERRLACLRKARELMVERGKLRAQLAGMEKMLAEMLPAGSSADPAPVDEGTPGLDPNPAQKRRTWGSGSVYQIGGRWWIRWRDDGTRHCTSFGSEDAAYDAMESINAQRDKRKVEALARKSPRRQAAPSTPVTEPDPVTKTETSPPAAVVPPLNMTRREQAEECRRLGIRGVDAVAAHLNIRYSKASYLCSYYRLYADKPDELSRLTREAQMEECRKLGLTTWQQVADKLGVTCDNARWPMKRYWGKAETIDPPRETVAAHDETAPVIDETPTPVPASMLQGSERPARGQRSQQIEECRRLGIRGAKAVAAHLKINVSYAGYLCSIHGLNLSDAPGEAFVPTELAPPSALVLEEDRTSAQLDAQVAEIVGTPETEAKIAALESKPVVVPFGISFVYDPAARTANRAQLKEETVKRQRGGKGRTVEFITVVAKNHVHVVTLDHFGDGQTNKDATGHVHRLCRWEMIEAHGHDHGLALTPPKGVDCAT